MSTRRPDFLVSLCDEHRQPANLRPALEAAFGSFAPYELGTTRAKPRTTARCETCGAPMPTTPPTRLIIL